MFRAKAVPGVAAKAVPAPKSRNTAEIVSPGSYEGPVVRPSPAPSTTSQMLRFCRLERSTTAHIFSTTSVSGSRVYPLQSVAGFSSDQLDRSKHHLGFRDRSPRRARPVSFRCFGGFRGPFLNGTSTRSPSGIRFDLFRPDVPGLSGRPPVCRLLSRSRSGRRQRTAVHNAKCVSSGWSGAVSRRYV